MTIRKIRLLIAGIWSLLVCSVATAGQEEVTAGFITIGPDALVCQMSVPLTLIEGWDEQPAGGVLDRQIHRDLRLSFGKQLAGFCLISADGEPVPLVLDRVELISHSPGGHPRLERRQQIPWSEAIVTPVLHATWSAPPKTLQIQWRFFPQSHDAPIPVELQVVHGDRLYRETLGFSKNQPVIAWALPAVDPTPPLEPVPVRSAQQRRLGVLASIIGAVSIAAIVFGLTNLCRQRARVLLLGLMGLALATASGRAAWWQHPADLSDHQRHELLERLLGNVHRSLDQPDETIRLHVMRTYLEEPLLQDVHATLAAGLEVEAVGLPVRHTSLTIESSSLGAQSGAKTLQTSVTWSTVGHVIHLGTVYRRQNRYRGDLRLEGVDGHWMIRDAVIVAD